MMRGDPAGEALELTGKATVVRRLDRRGGSLICVLCVAMASARSRAREGAPMEISTKGMPAINALDKVAETAFSSRAKKADGASSGGGDFANMIQQSLAAVNTTQTQAESLSHQYQLGQNDVSLEDAMISMQKANISFQTTIQVRNKLVGAYNDIMNMQI
jgi:flagellar hook-basal body complex protein FliE